MKYGIFLIGIIFLLGSACKRVKTPEAVNERETWINSFSDSVDYYKQYSEKIDTRLQEVNAKVADMLNNFEMVRNPREVSGYYILKGWNSKLPLITTGIYARINENEKIELIATLGGATFNQIAVGENYSEVVHHDQAFNFRHERYNTVYFAGGKADTIADYIATHHNEKLKLLYLEGKKQNSFIIPDIEKEMITETWNLYAAQKEAHELQKTLWLCSRKIDTFRRFMNEK